MVAALAAAAVLAVTPACRTAEVRQHDEVVFGHFATLAVARAYAVKPKRVQFQGVKIENDGCGDYEVEIDGADTQQQRSSVAAEAVKPGLQVAFEQTGEPLAPTPKQVYGVLGTFTSIKAANALSWRLAAANFRYIDIVHAGGSWLVVMPQVPVKSALSIAREVARAGFHVQFHSASG